MRKNAFNNTIHTQSRSIGVKILLYTVHILSSSIDVKTSLYFAHIQLRRIDVKTSLNKFELPIHGGLRKCHITCTSRIYGIRGERTDRYPYVTSSSTTNNMQVETSELRIPGNTLSCICGFRHRQITFTKRRYVSLSSQIFQSS